MTPKDVIRDLIKQNDFVVQAYLGDLSDAELLMRPADGANPIAWQLGHLIQAEQGLLKYLQRSGIELPPDWAQQYTAETSRSDSTSGYQSKAIYLDLYAKSRANVISVLQDLPDADLDRKTEGPLSGISPTWGSLLILIANHPMMHLGQVAVLRRRLNKPVKI